MVCAIAVALSISPLATAQRADDVRALTREVESLKTGMAAVLKELQEIKGVLQQAGAVPQAAQAQPAARAAPQVPENIDMTINVADAPFKGDKNAKVTVVEFTDYQCPFCSRHFKQTWPRLEADFVKTGKARFVLRDLPIESIHPQAFKAAEAAYCAGGQGKFWEMHDLLFTNQSALARPDLSVHAQTLGIDVAAFDKCVDGGAGAARIRQDISDSQKADAKGTPIFYVGLTDANSSQVKAVRLIRGAHSYQTFRDTIEGLLSAAK